MEIINQNKMQQMRQSIGCEFSENGKYAEMSMDVSRYTEKTHPIENVSFGFYSVDDESDLEQLKQIVASVDKEWTQYFDSDSLVFCAYTDSRAVSFCIVDADSESSSILASDGRPVGSIGCVGTLPQYRGRGIALRMVDLATVYLKEHDCGRSYIHFTHIDHWYSKLGYRTVARFDLT